MKKQKTPKHTNPGEAEMSALTKREPLVIRP